MSKPTRLAWLGTKMTASAIAPLLALDAKVDLMPIFKDLNTKNFSAKDVAKAVASACKGKTIAKDASFEHVASMLDKLEHAGKASPANADASVSEPQHKAMEAAAHGESNLGISPEVGKEFVEKDKGKSWDSAAEFLRGKGMSEDDIEALQGMLPSNGASDEADKEDEKHEDETHENDPTGTDEVDKEAEKKAAADKRAADKKAAADKAAKDKKAMDERLKSSVTKDQLDAGIKAAVEAERDRNAQLNTAFRDVRPWAGDLLHMAFDSAEDVYRHTLVNVLGVKSAKEVHGSALKTILDLQPKPGERGGSHHAAPELAMDESTQAEALKIAPGLSRIQPVY